MTPNTDAILRLIRTAREYLNQGEHLAPVKVRLEAEEALRDVAKRFLPEMTTMTSDTPPPAESDRDISRRAFDDGNHSQDANYAGPKLPAPPCFSWILTLHGDKRCLLPRGHEGMHEHTPYSWTTDFGTPKLQTPPTAPPSPSAPETLEQRLRQWQHDLDMMFGSSHVVSQQGRLLLDAADALRRLQRAEDLEQAASVNVTRLVAEREELQRRLQMITRNTSG